MKVFFFFLLFFFFCRCFLFYFFIFFLFYFFFFFFFLPVAEYFVLSPAYFCYLSTAKGSTFLLSSFVPTCLIECFNRKNQTSYFCHIILVIQQGNVRSLNIRNRTFGHVHPAKMQSDQKLHWVHFGLPMVHSFFIRTTKTLIRLRGCTG